MEKLYDNMSMEQLIELLKQKDEEIYALKKEIEEFKQEQLRELADKGLLFKQRRLVLKCTRQQLADKLGINDTAAAAIEDGAGNNIVDTYAKKIDISGMGKSVNGTAPDASGNVTVEEYTHPNSGVTAGTYRSVTVNAQGHVTAGSNPTLAIANGGTGATTASAALSNLGGVPTSEVANSANKIPRYNSSGHLVLPDGSEFWIA